MTRYKGPGEHSVYELEALLEEYSKRIRIAQTGLKHLSTAMMNPIYANDQEIIKEDIIRLREDLFCSLDEIEDTLDRYIESLREAREV